MTEEDGIEWDEVKDNLKILRVEESYFIDLGNPFQEERVYVPPEREEVEIYKPSISKGFVLFCFILILMVGFLFYRSEYINSVSRMSEEWETGFFLGVNYSSDLSEARYVLSVDIDTPYIDGPVKVDIEDTYVDTIIDSHFEVEPTISPKDKKICITFYRDSLLFGKKIIHSLDIFIPHFSLSSTGDEIQIVNHSPHRFLVYSPNSKSTVLHPGGSISVPRQFVETMIIVFIDLESGIEYRATVQR